MPELWDNGFKEFWELVKQDPKAADAAAMQVKELVEGVVGNAPKTRASLVPQKATDVLKHIQANGTAPAGLKGGKIFQNDGRLGGQVLPRTDAAGKPITYREWDVNAYQKGVNRGKERVVTGSDGKAYYTSDHYDTFTPIE